MTNNKVSLLDILSIIVAFFVAVISFFGGRWIYQKFFKANEDITGTQENSNKQETEKVKSDLETQIKKGAKLSYLPSVYKDMANQLFGEFGTIDKANIEDIRPILLKLKNTADILALSDAYGSRVFNSNWATPKTLSLSFKDCADYASGALWRNLVTSFGANKLLTK